MLSWLVLQLTDSPAMVSLVGFSRMLPMFLFGLVGGSLADRFAKKRVMLASQAISVATYVTMAGLLFLDIVKPLLRSSKSRQVEIDKALDELETLKQRDRRCQDAQTKAFKAFSRDMVDEDVYIRELASLKAERAWISDEQKRIRARLTSFEQKTITEKHLRNIGTLVSDKLDSADIDTRRWVLTCLDARVLDAPGDIRLELALPDEPALNVPTAPWSCCWRRRRCRLSAGPAGSAPL